MINKELLSNLINKCSNLQHFKQIHAQLIKSNLIKDTQIVANSIEFFTKNSFYVEYACKFLNFHPPTTSFPFNSMIASHADSKDPKQAIFLYKRLVQDGFSPDTYTFPVILKACCKLLKLGEGRQFHGVLMKVGILQCDIYVQNGLVHLYSSCGECEDADKLFDEMPVRDVVSWTGMVSGLVRAGFFQQATKVFAEMDVEPNVGTMVSVLVACGRTGNCSMGKAVHGLILKREGEIGVMLGNALMDMYVKCMCLDEAKGVFYELRERDAISWTCIISGLVQSKRSKEALDVFHSMRNFGAVPDKVTLSSVLSACASLGAIDYGKWVHEYVDRHGIEWDAHLGTSMIDMYAKCGSIEIALCIFHQMQHKNIFTWNALLGGLAMHGHGSEALDHFEQMLKLGIRPNEVTFLAVLTACSHNGLLDEARHQFRHMVQVFHIQPRIEHFGCMVDLLCRASLLEEAQEMIRSMPMEPDVLIWGALLTACKASGDVETSRSILRHVVELETDDSGVYVLLANIFASSDRWEDAAMVRKIMKRKGVKKFPGSSVIELDGKTHEFLVGDTNHPQKRDIHLVINILANHSHLEGPLSNPEVTLYNCDIEFENEVLID
ncbi:hypothetical protein ACHQM5_028910 [Ranunculus cassubicifolius]